MAFARIKFAKNLPSLEATNPRDIYFKPIFCINLGGNNFLDLARNLIVPELFKCLLLTF